MSSSPTRLPPFSLMEFRALVSAALDVDGPLPVLSPRYPTHSSSLCSFPTPRPTLERKKSLLCLHGVPASTPGPSRVRILLAKLKKRVAAALAVKRRRKVAPRVVSQISESSESDVNRDSVADSLFMPYHFASTFFAPSPPPSTSASASSSASASTSCSGSSESACPASSSSEGACSSAASPPPSPTASSFSDSGISRYPYPYYPYSHSTRELSADAPRPSSFLTDSAHGHTAEYEGAADPFAKGVVRVVHHSCEALPGYHRSGAWLRGNGNSRYGGRARPGREKRVRVRVRREEKQEEREREVDDSGVYVDVGVHAREDEEPEWTLALPGPSSPRPTAADYPSPPPSPASPFRASSSFNPPRTSTPPPPPTPTTDSPLARVPTTATARTYPALRRVGVGRALRPSSPFPLPLARSGTVVTR
ncbi:hypothetical protein DFH06DRAFT_1420970 [Mycena polygramma]|nr:hypothetical protein DFH06DRAFT_1420970 [Mycena polygramma]